MVSELKIEIGQRFDFEIDREDLNESGSGVIIATWYHNGTAIFVELYPNKSLLSSLKRYFETTAERTILVSIARISRLKYSITPTIVVLNNHQKDMTQIK